MLNERSFSYTSGCNSLLIELFMNIRKAAVLGAGTMGAGIATHLSNAGIATLLLDVAPDKLTPAEVSGGLTLESPAVRNRIVN